MVFVDDEHLKVAAELFHTWSQPTVYDTLPEEEKQKIEAAIKRLDNGEGIPADQVFQDVRTRLEAVRL